MLGSKVERKVWKTEESANKSELSQIMHSALLKPKRQKNNFFKIHFRFLSVISIHGLKYFYYQIQLFGKKSAIFSCIQIKRKNL